MIGYKLLRYKSGNLFPLYVTADEEIPVGIWLPAKTGEKTDDGKVKSRLGKLAYRPGWHINEEAPYVQHIYSIHGGKKYLKDGTIWAEVECHDKSYEREAYEAGWRNGKWSAVRACLDYIPTGGFYRYKTSPAMVGNWLIAGEMKVNRILTDEEVLQICSDYGYEDALARFQNPK